MSRVNFVSANRWMGPANLTTGWRRHQGRPRRCIEYQFASSDRGAYLGTHEGGLSTSARGSGGADQDRRELACLDLIRMKRC
jgi:hypothetical protein